jgi:tetratricopeptide (TPR) repeat protein
VDGVPLAIELAAARLREMPVNELADLLEAGVALLGERHSPRPERHRTMTAAIEWTMQSLEREEEELLLALSVCEGVFSLHAAEYTFKRVCNGKSFWVSIETLTERGLTKRPGAHGYMEVLATVRNEMRAIAVRLGKAGKYRESLIRYYSCWLRLGHRNFCRNEEAAWLREIDREYKTIEALLQWALYRDPIRASRLVSGLWFYWWNRGLAAQGYATIMRLLKKRGQLSVMAQGRLLGAAGNLAMLEDADEAVGLLREAVQLFESRHNADRLGWAVQSLGVALQEQGSLDEAATYLQKGLEIGLATHNVNRVAFCQERLGKLACLSDLHDDAKQLLVSGLQSAQARKDWSTVAYALCGLGDLAMAEKCYDVAIEHFERARAHFETLGQKIDIASTLERLARIHSLRDEESLAYLNADQSLALYREVDYEPGVLKALIIYADRALVRGDAARAIALLAGIRIHTKDCRAVPGLDTSISELDSAARSKVRKRDYDTFWRKGETLSVDDLVGVAVESGSPGTGICAIP